MIGTHNESSLHRELKNLYAGQGGQTEVDAVGFVADCISPSGEYVEVQTGNFGSLRKKAKELTRLNALKIVFPVIINKYIEVSDGEGNRLYRRKSPRRGTPWEVFDELIHAPELPLLKNITLEIVLVDAEERRVSDGKGSWRRKGVSIHDRRILALCDTIRLAKPKDYLRFVPFKKGEEFTSATLGEITSIGSSLAGKTLYVLNRLGVVKKVGKKGKSYLYRIV